MTLNIASYHLQGGFVICFFVSRISQKVMDRLAWNFLSEKGLGHRNRFNKFWEASRSLFLEDASPLRWELLYRGRGLHSLGAPVLYLCDRICTKK